MGSLLYLIITKLDISFVVNKLSQYMQKPTHQHMMNQKRVLRYLNDALHHGITIFKDQKLNLVALTDSDWAGDKDHQTSTSVYIIYLCRTPISSLELQETNNSCMVVDRSRISGNNIGSF